MKIVTVVGARPQFIKAAALSRMLRKEHQEILVHTGQHYDKNMSDVFFEELDIPRPDYNLGISQGMHGQMTGRMLEAIEEVLLKEKPDLVLVYGDTNSTLAGALAAAKLQIMVAHVEAGYRLGTLNNPEEINRILTDHVSSILFASIRSSLHYLKLEGLASRAYFTGDLMFDAFCYYKEKAKTKKIEIQDFDNAEITIPKQYYYMTCHRQENTDSDQILLEIMSAMECLDAPTIYPVHPRVREVAIRLKKEHGLDHVILCKPVSYLTSINLVNNAKKIVTDSGGLQREAFFAGKPCITIFDYVVCPETMIGNWNQLAKPIREEIVSKLETVPNGKACTEDFGNGQAGKEICEVLKDLYRRDNKD